MLNARVADLDWGVLALNSDEVFKVTKVTATLLLEDHVELGDGVFQLREWTALVHACLTDTTVAS